MSTKSLNRNTILIKFGARVKEERLKRGFSQESFAEIVGVHRTYIGMIERGEKNITLVNIFKISEALGLKVKDLIDF
jgi:transcriptional regulator with XRE-family HTH domain